MTDNGYRNHIANLVGIIEGLKGNADNLAVLQDRTTAVPGVDRRIDLHRKQTALSLGVLDDLNA